MIAGDCSIVKSLDRSNITRPDYKPQHIQTRVKFKMKHCCIKGSGLCRLCWRRALPSALCPSSFCVLSIRLTARETYVRRLRGREDMNLIQQMKTDCICSNKIIIPSPTRSCLSSPLAVPLIFGPAATRLQSSAQKLPVCLYVWSVSIRLFVGKWKIRRWPVRLESGASLNGMCRHSSHTSVVHESRKETLSCSKRDTL